VTTAYQPITIGTAIVWCACGAVLVAERYVDAVALLDEHQCSLGCPMLPHNTARTARMMSSEYETPVND